MLELAKEVYNKDFDNISVGINDFKKYLNQVIENQNLKESKKIENNDIELD